MIPLAPAQKEESILPYWWYDEDRADELDRAIRKNGFLPTVPETVGGISKETCCGPHVANTKELGSFKIKKSSSAGVRRIKAVIGNLS